MSGALAVLGDITWPGPRFPRGSLGPCPTLISAKKAPGDCEPVAACSGGRQRRADGLSATLFVEETVVLPRPAPLPPSFPGEVLDADHVQGLGWKCHEVPRHGDRVLTAGYALTNGPRDGRSVSPQVGGPGSQPTSAAPAVHLWEAHL